MARQLISASALWMIVPAVIATLIDSLLPGEMAAVLSPLSQVVAAPVTVHATAVSTPSSRSVIVREQSGASAQSRFGGSVSSTLRSRATMAVFGLIIRTLASVALAEVVGPLTYPKALAAGLPPRPWPTDVETGTMVPPMPGADPLGAVHEFLAENPAFAADREAEKFLMTWHPGGPRRIGSGPQE